MDPDEPYYSRTRAEKIVILTHFRHSARSEGAASSEKHPFVYVSIRCGQSYAQIGAHEGEEKHPWGPEGASPPRFSSDSSSST